MYPHERSLVAKLKGKPFALIGINSDSKDKVRAALKRENITWRSFWDGGDTNGPIATQYGVRSWPTIYILDHEGIIRYKGVRGNAMDGAVEDLLGKVSAGNVIHATSETFATHLNAEKPLLLDFYADW
jgi:peroxiredoxin